MESDPLQQLRDVHLPLDPSWWPPAIGWWLLVLLCIAALVWLANRATRAYRRRAAMRASRALLAELYATYQAGQLSAHDYLHKSNELLKRVLVRAYGLARYARLSGEPWLTALDEISDSREFTQGAGNALGAGRFRAAPEVDVDALHNLLQKLLRQAKPWRLPASAASEPVAATGAQDD